MTVEYATVRVQFGRAIGSYQSVKHGRVDMYSAWEQAQSAVRWPVARVPGSGCARARSPRPDSWRPCPPCPCIAPAGKTR
ncbi:acyl-CoA dehydrogenase family protein [Saccharopolyspora sp. NPDC000995]